MYTWYSVCINIRNAQTGNKKLRQSYAGALFILHLTSYQGRIHLLRLFSRAIEDPYQPV